MERKPLSALVAHRLLKTWVVMDMLELPLPPRSFSVLITTPRREYRDVFSRAFEPPEFETIFAPTPMEAIDIALERAVDLLVADSDLGGMTGVEIIRVIHGCVPTIPSILLGVDLTKEERIEALVNDVQTVIPKPPNYSILKSVTRQILARRYLV